MFEFDCGIDAGAGDAAALTMIITVFMLIIFIMILLKITIMLSPTMKMMAA